eukprot:452294_1
MSKKRADQSIKQINHQQKKRKLNPIRFQIKSIWFGNKSDHSQFIEIFNSIENSELSNKLQITHAINKEIAEYATGQFTKCDNSKCLNNIPILFE